MYIEYFLVPREFGVFFFGVDFSARISKTVKVFSVIKFIIGYKEHEDLRY